MKSGTFSRGAFPTLIATILLCISGGTLPAQQSVAVSPTGNSIDRAEAANSGPSPDDTLRHKQRARIFAELKTAMPALDSTRGLIVTLHDDSFRSGDLRAEFTSPLARIATIVAGEPGLHISVEGYSDSSATEATAKGRAQSVRSALIADGLPAGMVSAKGRGDSRPVESGATPEGRRANSRVELVVSGDAIGELPLWGHPYPLTAGNTH